MSVDQRLQQRRELAQPWVDEIRDACQSLKKRALPQSASGKAAAYTLNMWPKLARCLEYEQVELSNNLAENSMRPVALGRKNWLHVGSVKAGPKVAAILSVVESCRRLDVSVKDYLADVLPGELGASSVLCKRPFSLRRRLIWAVEKWESWFWVPLFHGPHSNLRFGVSSSSFRNNGFSARPFFLMRTLPASRGRTRITREE
jgi:Transposase IS66 family